jgi:hypothetical protein
MASVQKTATRGFETSENSYLIPHEVTKSPENHVIPQFSGLVESAGGQLGDSLCVYVTTRDYWPKFDSHWRR